MHARRNKWIRGIAACTLGMGVGGMAFAQPPVEPKKAEPQAGKAAEPKKDAPKELPKRDALPVVPPPAQPVASVNDDRFRQALAANPAQNSSVSPQMFADFLGGRPVGAIFTQRFTVQVPVTVTIPGNGSGQLGQVVTVLVPQQREVRIPFLAQTPGGTVGRLKVSEDNNPLPRDRVIFNYDYFSNTPLQPGGWNVNRFQFGFEKTFFDEMASIEVRLPFAGTLSNNTGPGFGTNDTVLGNARLVFKGLFSQSETGAFGGGVAVTLPTASDSVARLPNGREVLRFDNQAVIIEPYLALLLTPTDRLFVQNWASLAFDPVGYGVSSTVPGIAAQGLQRYHDRTVLSLDLQVGYWLTRNPEEFVRGLAPFVELHYNAAVSNGTQVRSANGLNYGGINDGLDELNVSTGVVADLRNNMNISLGVAFPMRNAPDRTFDYQVGLRLNWFFGPGAAARDALYAPTFGN